MADEAVNAVFTAIDRFTAPLKRMEDRTSKFIKSIEKGMGDVDRFNGRIMSGMKRVGAVGAVAGFATAAIVKDIVETGAQFDKTLVAAAAKFDPAIKRGTTQFEVLRAKAEEVGEKTEFSAQQAAEGLKNLAAAGFNANQAMDALQVVTDLATASETDYAIASEMAVKSLGAFGMRSEDAAKNAANLRRVVDVLAKTSGQTEASMEGLFESIKEGAPIAVAAGQSMETFMAMAGKLAAAGIEGSVAGTTLKHVFTSFSTKKGTAALAALGVKTKLANGQMLDAVEIMAKLEEKTRSMGSAKKLAVLEGIFGKIPLAGVSKLLDVGAEKLGELRVELQGADNYSAKLAETMRDTVMGDLDELSSKVDGVKIALFTTNNGPIRDVIQGMTQWVAANKEFIVQKVGDTVKWIADNIESLVTWVKRVAIGVAIFWAWSTAVKALVLAVEGYHAAVAIATGLNWAFKASMSAWNTKKPIQEATGQLELFDQETVATQTKMGALSAFLNTDVKSAFSTLKGGLGAAGLLGAAALVGYEFGSWLNEITGASDKVADFYGELFGLNDELNKSRGKMGGVTNTAGIVSSGDLHAGATANAAAISGQSSPSPKVVSPADRVASSLEEIRTTESAEVTIRDKTQRAEVTKKPGGNRVRLKMRRSGEFQ